MISKVWIVWEKIGGEHYNGGLHKSKTVPFEHVIFALGIRFVGGLAKDSKIV